MKIYTIPGKMEECWHEEARAVIDTWSSYYVSLAEFRRAVLEHGVPFAREHGAAAWIVDSSSAKGVFSQEIQEFISSDIFPAFVRSGIRYFITINSNVSAMTRMTVSAYTAKAIPNGLQVLEVNHVEDAVRWLKSQA